MRERLVVTLVAMTVGMIAVFGVVRAYSTADLVQEQERTSVSRSADLVAVAVAARGDAAVTAGFLSELTHRHQTVAYTGRDGSTIRSGPAAGHDDDITASRQVEGGGRVTLTQAASVGSDRVSDALLPLVLLGLGLSVVAAVIGWLLAQRFAHPFRRLAADAQRIGDGHFDVDVHRSTIREAAAMGDALRSAAGQLDALVGRERELAVVASHELRTPLTALRLSLEDLTLWPQTPSDVAAELQHSLAEVDRLSGVVTTLLERGDDRPFGAATEIDLGVVAAEAVERWTDRAAERGRRLVLAPSDPAPARVVRAPVDRVVDILIDNAMTHGTGTVTVDVLTVGDHLRLGVTDEGSRALDTGVLHVSPAGTEAGLTEAATRAEALGGFLGVGDTRVTRLVLVLPRPARG